MSLITNDTNDAMGARYPFDFHVLNDMIDGTALSFIPSMAAGVVDVTPGKGPNRDSAIDFQQAWENTPHMELRDRHVVVTGASRGIGNALARQFASRGARVTVVARNVDQLEQLAGEIGGHALPGMRERGSGHILNISSIAAYGSVLGMGIYSSSKAGLSQVTRAIRHEVKEHGIGFTAIAPGPVPTDFMANIHHSPTLNCIERFGKLGLLKEVKPEHVAKKAVLAVERGKSTVVMPRRAAMFGFVGGINQSIANMVIAGVK